MATTSAGTLASRVLGLVRDMALAQVWGAGAAMGGWVFAFTIPNLLRSFFAEGAFSRAFVPVFTRRLVEDGDEAAHRSSDAIVTALAGVVGSLVLLVVAGSVLCRPFVTRPTWKVGFDLLPWVMPYALLVCMANAFACILQAKRRFATAAFAPMLLNLAILAGALAAVLHPGRPPTETIRALPAAVLCAGLLHVALLGYHCARIGFPYHFLHDPESKDVRRVVALMAPVFLGVGATQLNVLVDHTLAGWIGAAAIPALYYSQRLAFLAVGVFGVALSQAALPELTRSSVGGDRESVRDHLVHGLRILTFLSLATAAVLAVVATPLVQLLFERGRFTAEGTHEVVWTLWFYLPGIPAFAWAKLASTPFFAAQDTRTPVRIALLCMGLNLVLNLVLMQFLDQGGLALATSLCSWINVLLLLHLGRVHTGGRPFAEFANPLLRMLPAAILAALAGAVAVNALGNVAAAVADLWGQILSVAAGAGVTGVVYLVLCPAFGCRWWQDFRMPGIRNTTRPTME